MLSPEMLAVFLPLLGFLIAGLGGKRLGHHGAEYVTTVFMLVAATCSILLFKDYAIGEEALQTVHLFNWFNVGDLKVDWALRLDTLTVIMLVVVNGVSAMVHLYSIGYMHDDPHRPRFFAYLSLFTFMMLMLVTADNLLQMFFGWEGVGLASYLLINFWFHKDTANAAAMKAFLVNRVGDFGFLLGIFGCFWLFGTVQFDELFAKVGQGGTILHLFGAELDALSLIGLFLFMGAMGKSAQLLLHTWLPDAMEGPTPVSALIHAATMVTAGVYMLCRLSPVYEAIPNVLAFVCLIGAMTAFVAATIGLTQWDIKRVIAYSTMSQLGYMFFAIGLGAYGAAMFHLTTHAFFKALLFLGAGSVIHAMSGEQDLRKMGGIWRKIPVTYALMWIGSLALAGIPYFAGYYSKDIILESAWAAHSSMGTLAYWLGIAAAVMTAFYSWRLLFLAFHGAPRADAHTMEHVHESPLVMLLPLFVLGAGALFSGHVAYDWFVGEGRADFWKYALGVVHGEDVIEHAHHVPGWVKWMPFVAAISGISFAYVAYMRITTLPARMAAAFPSLYRLFSNKWYFDEIYAAVFVRPAFYLGRLFWRQGDKNIIDGLGPDGVAKSAMDTAIRLTRTQTGYVYNYAFTMVLGTLALISWIMFGSR
jgi:NADH-quinone oxidoreductase subunit L